MTNKEIMQASLLDIIFENRNKEYGAYALRNDYDKRLIKALAIGLGLVLVFILLSFLKFNNLSTANSDDDKNEVTLINVEMQQDRPKEPELPKPTEKPPVAKVDYQPPVIVPDHKVPETMVDVEDIREDVISNTTVAGKPDNEPGLLTKDNSKGEGTNLTDIEKPPVRIFQRSPQYPGGPEALNEFLRNNLRTPEELEIGDKKTVRVKFIVGVDGTIIDISILESPGKSYDKEVTRVLRKMKPWEPAIQNDITVAVSFILPVTFVGVEE